MNILATNGLATLPAGTTYDRDIIRNGSFLGTADAVAKGTERVRIISYDNEDGTALASRVIVGTGQFIRLHNVFVVATSTV